MPSTVDSWTHVVSEFITALTQGIPEHKSFLNSGNTPAQWILEHCDYFFLLWNFKSTSVPTKLDSLTAWLLQYFKHKVFDTPECEVDPIPGHREFPVLLDIYRPRILRRSPVLWTLPIISWVFLAQTTFQEFIVFIFQANCDYIGRCFICYNFKYCWQSLGFE
jgi:hypothetical protein